MATRDAPGGGSARGARAVGPPPVHFGGRLWPADELAEIAAGWLDTIDAALPPGEGPTAVLLGNHPLAVALLFALSSVARPLVVLPPDARAWRSAPPLPEGTPVFVPPPLAALAEASAAAGLRVVPVPDPRPAPAAAVPFLACPGFVNFTSGSTGLPKPVYITTRSFLVQSAAVIEVSPLSPGDSVLGTLPLSTHYGLGQALILAAVLGSPLGLVERFDHRSVLRLLAAAPCAYWPATPQMADLLARAPLAGPCPPAPPICHISAGRLAEGTFHAFAARFGVRLRPSYGQTENGFIAVDTGAPEDIRPDRVGRPAPGIEVRIGDDPQRPLPSGELGRVWFRSPWYMEGYGFPPRLEPREERAGFWPTADVGFLDDAGYLALAGRADDCFKTAQGYLVNPAQVAEILASHPSVTEAVVLAVGGPGGPVIGAMVESAEAIEPAELRAAAALRLPSWLQPHVVRVARALPRLPGGKADRRAVRELLADHADR